MKRNEYQPIVDISEKLKKSIMRAKEFQNRNDENKNILAFSGGKDSLCAYLVMVKSEVEFIPIYSPTSADPPELIYYIREFNKWAKSKGYPVVKSQKYNKWENGENKGKIKTMWSLIENRSMPPTRMVRYCCDELKERTGDKGDTVYTGVRWEESKARADQKMVNFYKGKKMVRVIVDWSVDEVWSLILQEKVPYCCLYDKGFERIGCIGCPLNSKNQVKELNFFPKYKNLYIRAFQRMINRRIKRGKPTQWKTGEEVYSWWINQEVRDKKEEGQIDFFNTNCPKF